jgi:hypothetical protein
VRSQVGQNGNRGAGPNTGGMGAYSPAAVMTPAVEARVMKDIVEATANAMVAEGTPFRGVLFAGLMITDGKVCKAAQHTPSINSNEVSVMVLLKPFPFVITALLS